jgi:hypothetical protein
MKPILKYTTILLIVVAFLGSAGSARLRLDPINKYSAIVQFNKGTIHEEAEHP